MRFALDSGGIVEVVRIQLDAPCVLMSESFIVALSFRSELQLHLVPLVSNVHYVKQICIYEVSLLVCSIGS